MSFKACPLCGHSGEAKGQAQAQGQGKGECEGKPSDDGDQIPFEIIEHVAWKDIPFYHCQHCGIIFKDPYFWLNQSEEKQRYGLHHNVIENEGYVRYFDPLFEFLKQVEFEKKYLQPRILDYGCGPTPVLSQLMQNNLIHFNENTDPLNYNKSDNSDNSRDAKNTNLQQSKVSTQKAQQSVEFFDPFFFPETLIKAKTNNAKYTLITMTEVIEHCYEPQVVITEVTELLDKNGLWFVQTRLWSDVKNFSNWWYVRDPTHVIFYSEKTLRWICQKYHLTLLKTDHERSFLFQKNESPNDLQN